MDDRAAQRVGALLDALDGFDKTVRSLADDEWHRPTGCPGWSVKDVVSHVVGLESILLGEDEPDIDIPDHLPHVRDDVGRYMEMHVEARRDSRVDDLVQELNDVFGRRVDLLQAADDAALAAEIPGPLGTTWELGRSLGIRTFDIWAHEQDIRRVVDRPGHLDGAAAAVSLTRMIRGLTHYLPARVAPAAGVLRFEVSGQQAGTFRVDLGSGEPAPEDASPALTVRIDFADLVPLACGRDDAPDPARVATVEGDAALAAKVLTSLTITP